MTGLEGNQQAEQDVHEYSKTMEGKGNSEEGDEYEEEMEGDMEGGDDFVDHIQM